MASLVFAAAVTAPSSGHRLPSRRPAAPCRHRRRRDWPEASFVAVAEKLDTARKACGAAGTDEGEEEMGRAGVINGMNDSAVEEPVVVPFAPFEQSLVAVDRFGDDALSQAVGSKLSKLLEIVGLGYTIWFNARYLLFKKNRDELLSKLRISRKGSLVPVMSDMLEAL
ncbi:hypothetical protein QOZ80_6BG0465600 [Eleusine coracana subsp. coracana]|nr:hypothetical protein QOZ80_6BG0465600 [Eleusine coracana subsp. coracana]